ncbi:hypothetical protein MKZ38_010162 [Zalerion maritima]|uniref:Uncharacterized protein n=1 Tax=Zalerion maritima TaxID=339359 RepID=A0AAD5RTZ6_9PEZI|nr:hypothetical protein MKZ38_010162 [Zalerion maritima]
MTPGPVLGPRPTDPDKKKSSLFDSMTSTNIHNRVDFALAIDRYFVRNRPILHLENSLFISRRIILRNLATRGAEKVSSPDAQAAHQYLPTPHTLYHLPPFPFLPLSGKSKETRRKGKRKDVPSPILASMAPLPPVSIPLRRHVQQRWQHSQQSPTSPQP